ncbi:9953_t:CDS:2 [Diversispora eburnea]|uniref:9953_t:CDS:1 n=1 Tax=Diversispora eburnea TaxID=1213867 RepID=A0A9N9FXQ6_9GLOM|nr:9953_t:CDS:2 [Diversispora eburnea]
MSFSIDFIIDHSSDVDRCLDANSYIFPWDENFNATKDESQSQTTPLPKLKPDFQSSPITKSIPIISTPQPPKSTIIKLVIPKTAHTRSTTSNKTQTSEITQTLVPQSKSNMSKPVSYQEETISQKEEIVSQQEEIVLKQEEISQQEETVTNVGSEKLRMKQEWVKRMRLKFSVRPEFEITKNILHPDGTLNQDYFRPPKSCVPQLQRKWTEKERALLMKGIQKYGIGHYREISEEFLLDWTAQDLRVKTMRLIGRQNLQLYKDWKGNEDAIKKEYEQNKKIGLEVGMWKAGTLVYDEKGVIQMEK